jgi:carboxymethylenebutenolidase
MDNFDDLWRQAELTRRKLIAAGAASGFVAGFALSAQPVMAQTMIVTDTTGLQAGMVEVPTATGPIPAYRAVQSGAGARRWCLVVQEIFGLHEHIKDVCRRLAKLGYCAVRRRSTSARATSPNCRRSRRSGRSCAKVPDAQVMSDLDATVDWAAKSGAADPAKLAITGFCWGGRIVWLLRRHNPNLKAGVAWYGRLVGDKTANAPAHPVDLAQKIKAPILGLYGGQDAGIPVATTEQMSRRWAPARPRPSRSTPTRRTPSSPTTAPPTARPPPRTAGSASPTGSRRTGCVVTSR